jgi:uncharacterized Zn-binding protein involved in type VI secretion
MRHHVGVHRRRGPNPRCAALRVLGAALLVALGAAALAACGDDDGGEAASVTATTPLGPNPTPSNPGPNPSTFDPGPNPTAGGPSTVQGTVQVDPDRACIVLETDDGPLDLRFERYEAGVVADGPAVLDDAGVPVARNGDSMIVAGYPQLDATPCGTRFEVDSLVNVTPQL